MVILDIRNLYVDVIENGERFNIIDGVSFSVQEGEICALIGENGSGKSIISRIICNAIPDNWIIRADRFHFHNINLLSLPPTKRHKFINRYIAMIPQYAQDNFDPSKRIYGQFKQNLTWKSFIEPWWRILGWKKRRVIELLHRVGLTEHKKIMRAYPSDLTDGQKQRILIAIAIANNPTFLVADDPTQNLENIVTPQIFRLLTKMSKTQNMGILISSNELKMLHEFSDKLVMLYCGQILESGETEKLFNSPYSPYTKAILHAMPDFSQPIPHKSLLGALKGQIPFIDSFPIGCRFAPRCQFSQKICMEKPVLRRLNQQDFACHFPLNAQEKINKV